MGKSAICLTRMPYDDSAWCIVIRASSGEFAGSLEFYTNPEVLREFADRLAKFPSGPGDEARFALGSRDGNWAYYLLLRAFLMDRAGHAALEFAVDNRGAPPDHADASFFIPCDVEAIKGLGRQLRSWLDRSDESLTWAVANV
jgi:hypothetical protein